MRTPPCQPSPAVSWRWLLPVISAALLLPRCGINTTSSNPPKPDCKTDADCPGDEPYCIDRECMECQDDSDCPESDERCRRLSLIYGVATKTFVNLGAPCMGNSHCPDGQICSARLECPTDTRECRGVDNVHCYDPGYDTDPGDGGDTSDGSDSGELNQ